MIKQNNILAVWNIENIEMIIYADGNVIKAWQIREIKLITIRYFALLEF